MGCWSPDGKWIYFTSNRSGRREIWQIPASGGQARQITRHGADSALVSLDSRTLYFQKETTEGIFAIPSAGGQERRLVDAVNNRSFAVTKSGIYYTRWRKGDRRNQLCLLDLTTLKSRVLTVLDGSIDQGLTVSSDEKTVLYTRNKDSNLDLMLVENFR